MNKPLIMIVEDEEAIGNFISVILHSNDYRTIRAVKGKEAVSMAAAYCPDVILLDLGLPDMDGVEVLTSIRQWSNCSIIVVSARGHEREKVEALDSGADDYITKPFGSAELLARIRTAIRHKERAADATVKESNLTLDQLRIDYEKRMVFLGEKEVHLTPIEYRIIVLLSRNLGKVLTYDTIIKEVWGPYTNDIQTLRVNMANIRRKLEYNPAEPRYIITEVGVGYRMVE